MPASHPGASQAAGTKTLLCFCCIDSQHLSQETALLTICACVPDQRGKGYATKVVNALLDRCADRDVYLMCMPSLHDFYTKFGFITTGGFIY